MGMLSIAAFRAKGRVHRALQHQQWAGCQERLSTCSAAGWTKGFSGALARPARGWGGEVRPQIKEGWRDTIPFQTVWLPVFGLTWSVILFSNWMFSTILLLISIKYSCFFFKGTQIGSRSNPLFIKTAEEMEEYVSPYPRGIINKIYNVENSKDQQPRFLSK